MDCLVILIAMKIGTQETRSDFVVLSKSEIELVAYRSKTNLLNEDISSKHICLHHDGYYTCITKLFAKRAVMFLKYFNTKNLKVLT